MNVILVTRDGKRRSIKEKLALHLEKAGKGYIEGRQPFIADPTPSPSSDSPVDLFSSKDAGDNGIEEVSAPPIDSSEQEKKDPSPRRGRPSRSAQEYKTRMLQANEEPQKDTAEQPYQTTDLSAE